MSPENLYPNLFELPLKTISMNKPISMRTLLFIQKIQRELTHDLFKILFGPVAYHLWHRFTDMYQSNLLDFFDYLDSSHKDILIRYINLEMNHPDYL